MKFKELAKNQQICKISSIYIMCSEQKKYPASESGFTKRGAIHATLSGSFIAVQKDYLPVVKKSVVKLWSGIGLSTTMFTIFIVVEWPF